uniref:Mitochondrial ribosomal protein S18B n=1 Tax=Prolemur simus TaxID=1328070 RepID=A0A8C8YLL9_PROSS
MAGAAVSTLLRRLPVLSPFRSTYGVQAPLQSFCTKAPAEKDSLPPLPISPYEDEPWKYLESEEYQNRYGSRPVWADYRRNHKGGIPPQRTRKMCINVKLLEQFVCAHTGIIFHAPYTGLLSYHIPQVEPRDLDFSTSHGAVSATPPAPTLVSGNPWYPWYSWKQPPERELSRLRRLYQGHLLEESGPPPESMPEVPPTIPAEASTEQTGGQSAP